MSFLLRFTRTLAPKGLLFIQCRSLHNINVTNNTHIPQILQSIHSNNHWIWRKEENIELPLNNIKPIQLPNNILWIPPLIDSDSNIKRNNEIKEPDEINKDNVIEAARLIVIRRKKMKKHKLKKLRKKMKYEWAKVRQRRELKKEKAFQAVLIQQCKTAENFSAVKYVQEKLDKLNEVPIPKVWKGKRLPEFIIREKLGLPPK